MIFTLICVGLFTYSLVYIGTFIFSDCDFQATFYGKLGKSPKRLKGKVVFITGASSGIGEALATVLAKYGAKLALTARRKDELDRVKKICIDKSEGQLNENDVLVIPMDVTDLSLHKKNFDYAVRYFGKVDILINNAGRSQRAIFDHTELSVDRQIFELNLFAVVNLSRIAVNYFNTKGEGQIAVVSSLAGVIGVPYSAAYTGSKHAIHGYFNCLRNEKMGKGISVTLLCPGPTYSNFLTECFTEKDGEKYGVSVQATDRRMTAERCAEISCVSLVNKLNETWMGLLPIIPFTYVAVYFPTIFNIVLKIVGPEKLFKLRDSKEFQPVSEVKRAQ